MSELLDQNPEPIDDDGTRFGLGFVVFCWLTFVVVAYVRYQGPTPRSADIPDSEFSGERAEVILNDLVGAGIDHHSGTEENRIVRQKVIRYFEEFGYQVETQKGNANRWDSGEKIPLVNVFAKLAGDPSSPKKDEAILLLAHYDSAPGAVGAADDGAGMSALLEIARMMKLQTAPEREIIFLLTDGEEFGLLGAKMFVDANLHKNVVAVINLEARGTSGPSAMFETNVGNEYVVPLFARSAKTPVCSSLFFEIYQRMPNDTDFTVFKNAGVPGCNFAFIGDVENYHTMSDRVQNLDRRSLQHHGENMWRLVREFDKAEKFADADFEQTANVVYFDFFAWTVIWWPEYVNFILIAVAALAGGLALRNRFRCEPEHVRKNPTLENLSKEKKWVSWIANRTFSGWNFLLGVAVVSMLGCGSAYFAMDFASDGIPFWVNDAVFVEASLWMFSLCVITAMIWLFDKQNQRWHVALVAFAVWVLASLASSIWLPGASYLFVVPTILFGIAALLISKTKTTWFYVLFPIMVGLLWLPLERMFYDAIGFKFDNRPLIFRVVLLSTTVLPLALATRKKWVPIYSLTFATLGFICSLISVLW